MKRRFELTAIIEKSDDGWYVGQLQEIRAVLSQGKTIEELKENLNDALSLYLDVQKDELDKEYLGKIFTKETLVFEE